MEYTNDPATPLFSDVVIALIDQVRNNGITLQARPALVALHFLLPTLFLPALDLLDKSLVQKFLIQSENASSDYFVYYVRSTQSNNGSSSRIAYEVRPEVWSCTCPGFAVLAYCSDYEECQNNKDWGGQINGWPPLCKHLLACVLAERCGETFRVKHSTVTREELAEYGIP